MKAAIAPKTLKRIAALIGASLQFIALLALNGGAPVYAHRIAAALAQFGIYAFACTPNQFPDLMAAISRQDISQWAAASDSITTCKLEK